jgi:hypothetical protein
MPNSLRIDDDLPPWFVRPVLRGPIQKSLLLENLHEVLARCRVSMDDLLRWHENGWIPFALEDELEPDYVEHLCFVRDVVRSGLGDAQIARLIELMPKGLLADARDMVFSFGYGWVVPAFYSDAPREMDFDEALDLLVEEEDWERLIELRERIDSHLSERQETE